jgi:hypothetical protein
VARMGVGMPALYPFCGLLCSSFLHEAPLLPGSYSSEWFGKIIIEDKRAYVKVRFTLYWLFGSSVQKKRDLASTITRFPWHETQ